MRAWSATGNRSRCNRRGCPEGRAVLRELGEQNLDLRQRQTYALPGGDECHPAQDLRRITSLIARGARRADQTQPFVVTRGRRAQSLVLGDLTERWTRCTHGCEPPGPEFRGWLSNRGPIVADAMIRLGRGAEVER